MVLMRIFFQLKPEVNFYNSKDQVNKKDRQIGDNFMQSIISIFMHGEILNPSTSGRYKHMYIKKSQYLQV